MIVDPFRLRRLPDPPEDDTEAAYRALVLGTRDYVRKCGFSKVLIALSGGIDSALVAAIAAEALGAENVIGIGMPSPYSSAGSIDDSRAWPRILAFGSSSSASADLFSEYTQALEPAVYRHASRIITEENIQSRIRGNLLMALSNKFGCAGADHGQQVRDGSRLLHALWRHGGSARCHRRSGQDARLCRLAAGSIASEKLFPLPILEKPPSAELRPDQKDTDSLPPYEVLDPILEAYVERYETPECIAQEHGFSLELVQQVVRLVERSEYKRQQAAPVLKVTSKSFGMGRRFPIAVKVQV